jgi:hypothetical protein
MLAGATLPACRARYAMHGDTAPQLPDGFVDDDDIGRH